MGKNANIVVRRFKESDLDEVHAMILRAFTTALLRKVYEQCTVDIWTSVYTKEYIKGMSKLKHLYVALVDNKIVGSVAVNMVDSKAYLSALYVDPDYQYHGVGSKLMDVVEQDEISQKARVLFMNALLTAIKFYNKKGYFSRDAVPVIFSDCGVDVVQLYKEI